eukprot:1072506-Pelagomonas_calceolata.AAC.2
MKEGRTVSKPGEEELLMLEGRTVSKPGEEELLSTAVTSGYYYNSWQRLNHAIQPTTPTTTVISETQPTLSTCQQRSQQLCLEGEFKHHP